MLPQLPGPSHQPRGNLDQWLPTDYMSASTLRQFRILRALFTSATPARNEWYQALHGACARQLLPPVATRSASPTTSEALLAGYVYGEPSPAQLDRIDRNRLNDRIANLRATNRALLPDHEPRKLGWRCFGRRNSSDAWWHWSRRLLTLMTEAPIMHALHS